MGIRFTKHFTDRFTADEMRLVERIYNQYFAGMIEGDVKVGRTTSRFLGIAMHSSNYILLRKITPHTVAHELMHIAQHNAKNLIPSGEVACDIYTNSLAEELCDHSSYLRTNGAAQGEIHRICAEAVSKRRSGYRNYISWTKKQFR